MDVLSMSEALIFSVSYICCHDINLKSSGEKPIMIMWCHLQLKSNRASTV